MKTCIFNDSSGVEIKTAHAARVCAHIVFNGVVIRLALYLISFVFCRIDSGKVVFLYIGDPLKYETLYGCIYAIN